VEPDCDEAPARPPERPLPAMDRGRSGRNSRRHWSSFDAAWLPPLVGAGMFSLHCRLPFMRLLVSVTAPVFWKACRLPPSTLASASSGPPFSSNRMSPLMRAPEIDAEPPCTSCTEPPKVERLDNKYVVQGPVLARAVAEFAAHFDVLEIDGQRAFTYETCYFDGAERRSDHDHHQGRRQRMKVRVRRYVDAGLCFLEVKLKDRRGTTVKKRMPYDAA
jgi:hypothetical protein